MLRYSCGGVVLVPEPLLDPGLLVELPLFVVELPEFGLVLVEPGVVVLEPFVGDVLYGVELPVPELPVEEDPVELFMLQEL
jgi:hypothetical protein